MIRDYNQYQLSFLENVRFIAFGLLAVILLGILFYRSFIGIMFLSPVIFFYRRSKIGRLAEDRKWRLNLEFKDGITALAAALEAGYSAENAFEEAYKDLSLMYPEGSLILQEMTCIINQIRMNIAVEKALHDFGERTGIADIISFCEVFYTAKRTGGDLIHVIKTTSNVIHSKIEVKREIFTLIAAKRFEANIMKVTPLFILFYLSVTSPDFLNPLYHNVTGVTIMSLFLIIYLGAYLLINKIVAIEV